MHLLDTDIATLVFYGRNAKVLDRYEQVPKSESLVLSVLTRAEMLTGRFANLLKAATGAELLTAQSRLRDVEEWLTGFEIIEATEEANRHFDRLRSSGKRRKGAHTDLLIACIALAYDATLVTRNVKDFKAIPKLRVENWAD